MCETEQGLLGKSLGLRWLTWRQQPNCQFVVSICNHPGKKKQNKTTVQQCNKQCCGNQQYRWHISGAWSSWHSTLLSVDSLKCCRKANSSVKWWPNCLSVLQLSDARLRLKEPDVTNVVQLTITDKQCLGKHDGRTPLPRNVVPDTLDFKGVAFQSRFAVFGHVVAHTNRAVHHLIGPQVSLQ